MEYTTDNPSTVVAFPSAAAVPMPNVRSWNHVLTSQVAGRRIDGTRVSIADNYTSNNHYTAEGFTGTFVAALTKQGAPPRGEPR
ncbi:hypothetical protein [uncultured Jatrophihabitans sp.]|uniref:hypothetical protein n=1 Tax=uncultured Jatrophihabitans sp. TaxID=1610747 RepID=UPI0035C984D7